MVNDARYWILDTGCPMKKYGCMVELSNCCIAKLLNYVLNNTFVFSEDFGIE